jgi:hypothetical protein
MGIKLNCMASEQTPHQTMRLTVDRRPLAKPSFR